MPSQAAKKSAARSSSLALFARNFLKSPLMLASVVPSSSFLVNDMMSQVDRDRARVLVEYGPGVGHVHADFPGACGPMPFWWPSN